MGVPGHVPNTFYSGAIGPAVYQALYRGESYLKLSHSGFAAEGAVTPPGTSLALKKYIFLCGV